MSTETTYSRSAAIYDLIYAFKDFPATSERLRALIAERVPAGRSLLDVGCGTGRHLELLGPQFERTGLDLSAEMLQIARQRCPDVAFHCADMADFTLGRTFDVVTCLFSAVAYVRSPARLVGAIDCMAQHLVPGGLLLVEPWVTPESYLEGRVTLNVAENDELKVSWMYTAERDGAVSRFDINYLVGHVRGVEHFVETHEMGLFTDEEYQGAFTAAGLDASYDATGLFGRGIYLAVKG